MTTQTFEQYWRSYLAGHNHLPTRLLHYLGLIFGPLAGIACSILYAWWAFFVVYPMFYTIALVTHPLFEHNTNEPFAKRPWWSVVSLFKMFWLDLTGQFSKQIAKL